MVAYSFLIFIENLKLDENYNVCSLPFSDDFPKIDALIVIILIFLWYKMAFVYHNHTANKMTTISNKTRLCAALHTPDPVPMATEQI